MEAGIPNALLKRRKRQRRQALARVMADPTLSRRQRDRLAASGSAVWDEASMMPYDTFDDYTEMMIQFGYVTFFSLAWPLAPLFALINNVVEIRTDAFRLCYLSQRPVAHRAGGIGVWFNVLQSMSVLAIMTNCAHIGFTSRHITTYFPGITEGQKVFAVFMFEVRAQPAAALRPTRNRFPPSRSTLSSYWTGPSRSRFRPCRASCGRRCGARRPSAGGESPLRTATPLCASSPSTASPWPWQRGPAPASPTDGRANRVPFSPRGGRGGPGGRYGFWTSAAGMARHSSATASSSASLSRDCTVTRVVYRSEPSGLVSDICG